LQQLVGGLGDAFGDFGFCDLGLAELLEHFAQRRFGNARRSGYFRKFSVKRFLENSPDTVLVQADVNWTIDIVASNGDALSRRACGAPPPSAKPSEHRRP
jgi:hypothetical protein